jgi:type I restriction enzyme S subunit
MMNGYFKGVIWRMRIAWKKYRMKYAVQISPPISRPYLNENSEATFLPMNCIRDGYFIPNSAPLSSFNSSYNSFENGDILLAKVTPCFENGNLTIVDNLVNGFGYGTSEIFVLRANQEIILRKYLFYALQEYNFKSFGVSEMTGTAGLKRVPSSYLDNHILFLPSITEQTIIVRFLDDKCGKIDALIENEEKTIAELKEFKKSIIQREIENNYQNWERARFSEVFELGKGLGITKADLQDEGIPVVSYGEIHSKYNRVLNPDVHPLKYVKNTYLESDKKSLLKFGDFVFADTSEDLEGSGNFTFLDSHTSVFAGYHTIIARPKIKVDYLFLSFLCDSSKFREQIQSRVVGIKVFSITKGLLKNVDLWLPPLPEQKAIAEHLDKKTSQIDTLITLKQQKISELKEYKKSLIYEYVTGKKELKT